MPEAVNALIVKKEKNRIGVMLENTLVLYLNEKNNKVTVGQRVKAVINFEKRCIRKIIITENTG